jgi:hypothetical protein
MANPFTSFCTIPSLGMNFRKRNKPWNNVKENFFLDLDYRKRSPLFIISFPTTEDIHSCTVCSDAGLL